MAGLGSAGIYNGSLTIMGTEMKPSTRACMSESLRLFSKMNTDSSFDPRASCFGNINGDDWFSLWTFDRRWVDIEGFMEMVYVLHEHHCGFCDLIDNMLRFLYQLATRSGHGDLSPDFQITIKEERDRTPRELWESTQSF